jgi:hypothetical protein
MPPRFDRIGPPSPAHASRSVSDGSIADTFLEPTNPANAITNVIAITAIPNISRRICARVQKTRRHACSRHGAERTRRDADAGLKSDAWRQDPTELQFVAPTATTDFSASLEHGQQNESGVSCCHPHLSSPQPSQVQNDAFTIRQIVVPESIRTDCGQQPHRAVIVEIGS